MRLAPEERRAWEEDGFFVRAAAFDAEEVARLQAAAERVVAVIEAAARGGEGAYLVDGNRYQPAAGSLVQFEHAPGSTTVRVIEPFHHLDAVFDALVDDPRLVEPMRDLVGSARVSLWTDKLNLKRPREGSRFRFHQDSPYWAFACGHLDRLPNVMVVLDDATEMNGCFRVVRGSHRRGLLPGIEGEGMLGPLFTDPRHFDQSAQVPIEAPAGSLVFFSPHTVHGSEPNRSDRARRAAVLTYQPHGFPMFQREGMREAGAAR
jgi:ectoine hydroxylase-related dioxygenase (phytanoyl-CoA dioxygenase family)